MVSIKPMNDVFKIEMKMKSEKDSTEFLFVSDVHFDSKKSNRKVLKRLFDEALERDAQIMIFGDLLDVMGAKYDPRSGKSDIRPEYNNGNYFQLVVDDLVSFLKPYSKNILFISEGNHEYSVKQRHEFDLLQILSYKLKYEAGWEGVLGRYEGWLMFKSVYPKREPAPVIGYYTHGSGGNAPVTRGVINTNRRQVQIQADLFISGHIHTSWSMPVPQRSINTHGFEKVKDVLHLQLGCFKESHRGSWEAMKGFGASNIGGYWLKFYSRDKEVLFSEERAV
jgi:hypothetical protein